MQTTLQGKELGPRLSVRLTVASNIESKEAAVAVHFWFLKKSPETKFSKLPLEKTSQ